MPEISIIVPIYNMQHLMRICIDSLLAQTFTDFELLLIDDGSTDSSPTICDEYLGRDKRISVYHKQNGGLSDARNFGIAHAKGKYCIFADPDDWVSPEGLDRLYARAEAEHADVTICDLYREDEYSCYYVEQRPTSLDHNSVLNDLGDKLGGFTWNKLIRTSLYATYNIAYPKGMYGCEDQFTMMSLMLHDVSIAYEPVAFYHYMYNPTSLSRHYDENTYKMDIDTLKMFDELLQGHSASKFVHQSKYNAILIRAFWYGRKQFTSKSFKKHFFSYKNDIFAMPLTLFIRSMLYLSCIGLYRPVNGFVLVLFKIKRLMKQILGRFK